MSEQNTPPRRRVEIELKLGADSWEEAAYRLKQIAREILMGQHRGDAVSGSSSSGYTFMSTEDKSVTNESYHRALDEYLTEERVGDE